MPAKKKTKTAASSPKKGTRKRTTKAQKQQAAKRETLLQIWGIVLFAVGAFLLFTLITGSKAPVVHGVQVFFFGLFSKVPSFLLPALMFYVAVYVAKGRSRTLVALKVWTGLIMMILLSAMWQIFFCVQPSSFSVSQVWEWSQVGKAGGLLGGLPGWLLVRGCDKAGAIIVVIALFLIDFVLLFGINPLTLFKKLFPFNFKRDADDVADEFIHEPTKREKPAKPVKPAKPERMEPEKPRKDFPLDVPISLDPPAEQPAEKAGKHKATPAPDLEGIISKWKRDEDPSTPAEEPVPVEAPVDSTQEKPPEKVSVQEMEKESREIEKAVEKNARATDPFYYFPPLHLLAKPSGDKGEDASDELKYNAQVIVDTLRSFRVETKIVNISRGPSVTRYEIAPETGVKMREIVNLSEDIALALAANGVRVAPVVGKSAVGIEVPNKQVSTVTIREILESKEFTSASSCLTACLGRDIGGAPILTDIEKLPHMLIAGQTGSGKTVCINSIITSLLYKATPDEVKLIMVDPKRVELGVYNGIPHLLIPVVCDVKKAAGALQWAVREMEQRYILLQQSGCRDLKSYNEMVARKNGAAQPQESLFENEGEQAPAEPQLKPLPRIVMIIDELADLMLSAPKEVEASICRLAQMARAAGMHLIIGTQRPSVDVITGTIKANIPARIAFAVASQIDSRTILDGVGAEKLLGRGDMLYKPSEAAKTRVQGCFVSESEVQKITDFLRSNGQADYDQTVMEKIDNSAKEAAEGGEGPGGGEVDPLFMQAVSVVVENGTASTSLLTRRLSLGYGRAARIMDQMEARGIIGPFEGSKPRQVLITKAQLDELKSKQ